MKNLLLLFACAILCAIPSSAQQRNSIDHFKEANVWYVTGNYAKAIKPYQKALDLEQKERKLEKEYWFALVNNLALSYANTRDLKRAMSLLDYGIKEEPTYPLFYYIMASGHALQGNEDKAIENLRLAYRHKANVAKDRLPDPMTDASFAKFRKSEKFVKAVAEMKSASATAPESS